jgi:hypothetical protein
MIFLKNKYTVFCHEPTENHQILPMLHLWNYPTLSKRRGKGLHIPSLANSNLLYKAHSVSKVTHSTKKHKVGKGGKKGTVKYITKKININCFYLEQFKI